MISKTSENQMTFVDTTETGRINKESVIEQVNKLNRLGYEVRGQIRDSFCNKYAVSLDDYSKLLNYNKTFTAEQFYDFRDAIQYYTDRKRYPIL